ncbi:hypothetical protein [Arthrobacter sp. H5]|uniref:hypothetical protein n=1 Tax=Arthrobacter sp. H5 TaxID=1267973 RepID=UPI0004B498E3|nr:hypothetical protein [Arthrobacter sp. H5]
MSGKLQARIAGLTGVLLLVALAFHLTELDQLSDTVLFVASIISGTPIAIKAFQAARANAFSIDLLVTIAVIGALIIGEYVEGAVVSFLFIFGAYLEARTPEKTRRSLRDLVDMAPQEAQVLRNGQTLTLPVEDIVQNDHVLVASGGKIAVGPHHSPNKSTSCRYSRPPSTACRRRSTIEPVRFRLPRSSFPKRKVACGQPCCALLAETPPMKTRMRLNSWGSPGR